MFGDVSVSGSGGSVRVDENGIKVVTGGVSDEGGTHSAAQFDVSGDANATYDIDTPNLIFISNGTSSMRVATFTTDKTSDMGMLDPSGDLLSAG